MKKYIVNQAIGEFFIKGDVVNKNCLAEWFTASAIKRFIKDGVFEEIQEPRFTENDMIEFIQYFCHKNRNIIHYTGSAQALEAFNEWIKSKIKL